MNRREFVSTAATGIAALPSLSLGASTELANTDPASIRAHFPRLANEVFLNAAGGTPLGKFAEGGMEKYLTLIREGPAGGTRDYFDQVLDELAAKFGGLIGAGAHEIGFVECTKRGEQIALDGVSDRLIDGGNVVSNDLHFSGSLHNLEGIRRAGSDVRIVKSEGFRVPLERMAEQIDDNTALVTVSLMSNINGHIEPIEELAALAHRRGALLFADIIQAAGCIPIDVKAMGIDIAACSSYKWLFGIHGAGFLFVDEAHQGKTIPDLMFPGRGIRNYAPFRVVPDAEQTTIGFRAPSTASRYQPGHVNYLGYTAAYEGLKFIEELGIDEIQAHAVRLNGVLLEQLDHSKYDIMSTHVDQSPILTLAARDFESIRDRLRASECTVGIGGDKWDQIRISPAIYNSEDDMWALVSVLNT